MSSTTSGRTSSTSSVASLRNPHPPSSFLKTSSVSTGPTDIILQEDETELSRRKDAEEELDIDVLSPQDDWFPRRPRPPVITSEGEGEEARAARSMADVARWADAEPDGDDWEGFYLSLDLLEETGAEQDGAG